MNFNQNQLGIINNINGAYLISAPVGTGKTTVLTERIIKALDSGVKPEEVLCLTFTNRAAEEMRGRIKKRIGEKGVFEQIFIGTFHGFCVFFIKAEAKQIGIDHDFVILDEDEQFEIMKNILDQQDSVMLLGKNEKRETLDLIERIYKRRLARLEIAIGCTVPAVEEDGDLDELERLYVAELENQSAFDFNELVLLTLKSLYFDARLKNKWAQKFKLIQLDEFQDTHLSEYLVIKELAKQHKNVALIGDLDQTIYSWRGSEPFFIASLFRAHFAPVREMHLETNYRFDQNILAAIKSFLTSMEGRTTKKIESDRTDDGEKKCIKVFGGHNLSEEASWVMDSIQKIRAEDKGASVAVLARSNFVINNMAAAFEAKGVAHITVDKYDFFRRQEVKDLFAYLKILFNKYDLESAYRIVSRPARNIGELTLRKIREEGGASGLRVSDFLDFKNFNYPEPFFNLINKHQKGRLIVLDTETTGINPLKDEVIQIYAVEIVDGVAGKDFEFLLKNTKPVGLSAEVHGLTDEHLAEHGRDPREVLRELKGFIGTDIAIGHNVNFDLSMIVENGKRHDVLFEFKEYYDTLDLARRLVESENYKLGTLVKKFGLSQATHNAKDDVLATVGLLNVLVEKLLVSRTERVALFAKFSGKFIKLAGDIKTWQSEIKKLRPVEALDYIWEQSGLRGFYNEQKDADKRLKSIAVLREVFQVKDDAERPAETVLRELINYAALTRDINFLGVDQGKVPIVTVHQVKGLEFDYVFVIGMNDFKFPMYRSDVEEEKRLFYVALTRAKKRIYLSYSRFDDYNRNLAISPFIGYLDGEYVENIS